MSCISKNNYQSKAFTLIELLVVISIISLLSSVVIASLNTARDKGRIAAAQKFATSLHRTAGDQNVGLWRLEEVVGQYIDTSGMNNHANIFGTIVRDVDGFYPTSKGFQINNGQPGYISISDTVSNGPFDFGVEDFTISFWTLNNGYVGTGSALNNFVSKVDSGVPGNSSFGIMYHSSFSNHTLRVFVGSNAFQGSKNVGDGKWHHVALVRQGIDITLYVDGVTDSSITVNPIQSLSNNNNLLFGSDVGNLNGRYIKGSMDDISVYKKALVAKEVRDYYLATKDRYIAIE